MKIDLNGLEIENFNKDPKDRKFLENSRKN